MALKRLNGNPYLIQKGDEKMYVYQLTYDNDTDTILTIGYFGSWKKARKTMKKYRSSVKGFKEQQKGFMIKKIRLNEDNYYYLK